MTKLTFCFLVCAPMAGFIVVLGGHFHQVCLYTYSRCWFIHSFIHSFNCMCVCVGVCVWGGECHLSWASFLLFSKPVPLQKSSSTVRAQKLESAACSVLEHAETQRVIVVWVQFFIFRYREKRHKNQTGRNRNRWSTNSCFYGFQWSRSEIETNDQLTIFCMGFIDPGQKLKQMIY